MDHIAGKGSLGMPPPGIGNAGTAGVIGRMRVVTQMLPVGTEGNGHMVDLTSDIQRLLGNWGFLDGHVTIFVPGSTASLTTIEYEPGLEKDFPDAMERIAPSEGQHYLHDEKWGDGNGHSGLSW